MSQADSGDTTKPPGRGTEHRSDLPMLVYKGEVIHERHEMLSLTDMWKASGSPDGRRPDDWKKDSANRAFLDHVAMIANAPVEGIWKGRRGVGGGTWAHWQIALAYAKYLSPDFHMWCNTVVRERMEGIPRPAAAITTDLGPDARRAVGGIVKSVVPGIIAEALAIILPEMVREHVTTRSHTVVEGVSAGQVIEMAGIAKRKGLRGLPVWVSNRLRHFHAARGVAVRLGTLGSRSAYVFDPLVSREWLAAGGQAEVEKKIAERRGQGSLRLA